MKIGVIMYGGIGDHLLANRFIPAILNYHKEKQASFQNQNCRWQLMQAKMKYYPGP